MTAGGVGVKKKTDQGMGAPRETFHPREQRLTDDRSRSHKENRAGSGGWQEIQGGGQGFLPQTEFKSCHFM